MKYIALLAVTVNALESWTVATVPADLKANVLDLT
jgi:hypothetical protein